VADTAAAAAAAVAAAEAVVVATEAAQRTGPIHSSGNSTGSGCWGLPSALTMPGGDQRKEWSVRCSEPARGAAAVRKRILLPAAAAAAAGPVAAVRKRPLRPAAAARRLPVERTTAAVVVGRTTG